MGIETGHGNPRQGDAPHLEKPVKQAPHPRDLTGGQRPGNLPKRNVRCHKGDRQRPSGEQHGMVFHARSGCKELGLSGIGKPDPMKVPLVNRTGHDSSQLPGQSPLGSLLQRRNGSHRTLLVRMSRRARRGITDHLEPYTGRSLPERFGKQLGPHPRWVARHESDHGEGRIR